MDDLISRQAAIDSFPEDALAWDISDGYIAPHYVRKILEQLPSAEPKKGKWIERWHNNQHVIGDMACSVCGAQMLLTFPRFCPCCGAYMREEEQDATD